MPIPGIPYIDPAQLKAEADKLIPVIEAVDTFVPGASTVNNVLGVLEAIVDNDQIRIPVVNLINQISGAKAPS